MSNRGSFKEREEKFVDKLHSMGRYTYISGFVNSSSDVTVRHNKCGNIITRRASSVLYLPRNHDYCEHCKPVGFGVYNKDRKSIKERQLTACDKEAGKIFAVIMEDGILRGEELVEYIKLCTDNLIIANRDGITDEEIFETVFNGVKARYKKRGLQYE